MKSIVPIFAVAAIIGVLVIFLVRSAGGLREAEIERDLAVESQSETIDTFEEVMEQGIKIEEEVKTLSRRYYQHLEEHAALQMWIDGLEKTGEGSSCSPGCMLPHL